MKLPDVLPAEFLTDSESDDEDEQALRVVRPKKINFETAVQMQKTEGRAPRDQVVGATVYRVMADQGDKSLAPRMHKNSAHAKRELLRRHRNAVVPVKTKGFFKRK
jgi:U3 small nucleolar RNA-associated protein 16